MQIVFWPVLAWARRESTCGRRGREPWPEARAIGRDPSRPVMTLEPDLIDTFHIWPAPDDHSGGLIGFLAALARRERANLIAKLAQGDARRLGCGAALAAASASFIIQPASEFISTPTWAHQIGCCVRLARQVPYWSWY